MNEYILRKRSLRAPFKTLWKNRSCLDCKVSTGSDQEKCKVVLPDKLRVALEKIASRDTGEDTNYIRIPRSRKLLWCNHWMVAHAGNALYYNAQCIDYGIQTSMQWGKNWFNTGVVLTAQEIAAAILRDYGFALPIIGYLFGTRFPRCKTCGCLCLDGINEDGECGLCAPMPTAAKQDIRSMYRRNGTFLALHIQRSYFFTYRFELGDAAYQYQIRRNHPYEQVQLPDGRSGHVALNLQHSVLGWVVGMSYNGKADIENQEPLYRESRQIDLDGTIPCLKDGTWILDDDCMCGYVRHSTDLEHVLRALLSKMQAEENEAAVQEGRTARTLLVYECGYRSLEDEQLLSYQE